MKINPLHRLAGASCALGLAAVVFAQGSALAPAASELARSSACRARVGSCSSGTWSPDGRTVAFLSHRSGNPQIWTMPASGGFPTQVTALESVHRGEILTNSATTRWGSRWVERADS